MKKLALLVGVMLVLGFAGSALAVEFQVHGDMNNRFMLYTNQAPLYSTSETAKSRNIDKNEISEAWMDIKYRIWFEAASDDGKVKGVYAIELGNIRAGDGSVLGGSTKGGAFSGDGINIETRWAYTDFQIPGVASKARITLGLMPFDVNPYFWSETAMGIRYTGAIVEPVDLTLAWIRGREFFNTSPNDDLFADLESYTARLDVKSVKNVPFGVFAVYQARNPQSSQFQDYVGATDYEVKTLKTVDFSLWTLGTDGKANFGTAFVNWDLMYQTGSLTDNSAVKRDISAYFVHADVGVNIGNTRVTYTGWYASGDDSSTDDKIKNYLATDVDMTASRVLMEGGYNDDNYFTEAPYVLDKGLFLNKLAVDHKATKKLTVGAALLYLQTAEDLTLAGGKTSKNLGTELDAYLSYQLWPSTKLEIGGGYLWADDAMDFFEVASQRNGSSDTDIYRADARIRYSF